MFHAHIYLNVGNYHGIRTQGTRVFGMAVVPCFLPLFFGKKAGGGEFWCRIPKIKDVTKTLAQARCLAGFDAP